jgi:riboflavin kinase / FMN adenylyltransferase
MQTFNDIASVTKDENTVLTLGTFDGIHLGHKKIIENVIKKASDYNARNFLVTFYPHPRNVLSKNNSIKILSTFREKAAVLENLGIENLLIIEFTNEFSKISAERFIKEYIVDRIGIKEIVIGYDHHFGKGRSGNIETLKKIGKESGFKVTPVDEVKFEDQTISSTKIRNELISGNINLANSMLGRYYSFSGTVVYGDKRGRSLGFPTANIELDDSDKLLPALGIYAVEFFTGAGKYYGLLSVGRRPTFYDAGNIVPEVYIFDFDKDIYNEYVTVNIVERIRGEEKFPTAEALVVQMKKDKEIGSEILSKLVN